MVYIAGGEMQGSRNMWRLSIIPEMFWGLINFIVLFFKTMVNPSLTKHGSNHTSDYKPDGGGGPRRRMGGFRGRGGGPASPPMAGGG